MLLRMEKKEGENQKEQSLRDFIDDFPYSDPKEQKPAWSEEDERMLSRCVKSIESSKQFADSDTFKKAKDNEIDWLENRLKSLRPKSKEELAKMLQDEYNKGKEEGERIGHTKGYNKGYKDAEEAYNKAVSYHP